MGFVGMGLSNTMFDDTPNSEYNQTKSAKNMRRWSAMVNSDSNKAISPYYSLWLSLDEEKFDKNFSETKMKYWRVYKAIMDAPIEMDLSQKEMRDLFNKLLDIADELFDEVIKEDDKYVV